MSLLKNYVKLKCTMGSMADGLYGACKMDECNFEHPRHALNQSTVECALSALHMIAASHA